MFGHIFVKILGLAPFSIKINQHNANRNNRKILEFKYSQIGCAYNIILILLLFSSNFLSIPAAFKMKFENKPQLVRNVFLFKLMAGISVLSLVWIIECLKQQSIVNVANEIVVIDHAIDNIRHIYSIQSVKWKAVIYFTFNLLIWISLITLDYIIFPLAFGVTSIPILLPNFICSFFLLEFAFILNLLEVRLKNMNIALQNFSKYYKYHPECTVNETQIIRKQIRDILVVKRYHELLYEITRTITNRYALTIFIIITFFSGNIIFTSYYFVQLIINPTKIWSTILAFNSAVYLTMELFPIIMMTISVTQLTHQIDMTPNILHQIMDYSIDNCEIRSQLRLFSIELLHRKIQITAFNFIPLDVTLLHSVVGMVTNYLVILLQIQFKSNK